MDQDHIRVPKRYLKAGAALGLLVVLAYALRSDTMKLSTYYPAPAGVYKKIITTSKTILARDRDAVGIGTSDPVGKLHVEGDGIVLSRKALMPGRQHDFIIGKDNHSSFHIHDRVSGEWVFNINDRGKVGIGVEDPQEKLEVAGNVKLSPGPTGTPTHRVRNVAAPIDVNDVAIKGYVDAASGGGGGTYVAWGKTECAPGWTPAYTGVGAVFWVNYTNPTGDPQCVFGMPPSARQGDVIWVASEKVSTTNRPMACVVCVK